MTNDVVIETLAEKIRRQDRYIAQLQADLKQAQRSSIDSLLGQLRLREAVLLYVGQDAAKFAQQIVEAFGTDVEQTVSNSLFVLDNAPVPPEVRDSIREATKGGMHRW